MAEVINYAEMFVINLNIVKNMKILNQTKAMRNCGSFDVSYPCTQQQTTKLVHPRRTRRLATANSSRVSIRDRPCKFALHLV